MGVGPSDEILLDEPSVLGLINDGDESVVETVYVYMDGCPLLSITPPENGRGDPQITMVDNAGNCVPAQGTDPAARAQVVGAGGMRVQLWQDNPSQATSAENDQGKALVVEISNLYPGNLPDPRDANPGDDPLFYIPGVLGDPSGDLLLASADGGGANPFGPGGGGWFGPGSGGGSGGGSGPGGGYGPGGGPGGFPGGPSSGPGFPGGPSGGNGGFIPPSVTAVPLPATLLLLLWALQLLRSYVRRT